MKSSQQRKDVQNCCSALHTNKNFIRNWLVVYKLRFSRKKIWVDDIYTFLNKPLDFLDLLLYPLKFRTKQSFILGNPTKLCDTSWERNQILCNFSSIVVENSTYFLFNPRQFHMLFLQYSWKIQVLEYPILWLRLNG